MKLAIAILLVNLAIVLGDQENTISYYDYNEERYVTDSLDGAIIDYSVDIKKMHFMLYTQSNRDSPYELFLGDSKVLEASPFNPNVQTKILIHGYASNYEANPPQQIKNAYLSVSNVNVIAVDYKKLSSPYLVAVGNSDDISKKIASFVQFLINQGKLNINDLHIIGHSLGAHIAGFVAQNLPVKVPRITGLDPAGPLFALNKASKRLSADDAIFVDAIHTSVELGISKAIATSDFFANGGTSQPECLNGNLGPSLFGSCDHASSYRYFVESIKNSERYPARRCNSESDAKRNKGCSDSSAVMGESAGFRSSAGTYYVHVA